MLGRTLDAAGFKEGEVFQLVAIQYPRVDGPGNTTAQSFTHDVDLPKAVSWVEQWDGKRNLYLCGNPLKNKKTRKARDVDIAACRCLLVDIDPTRETPSPSPMNVAVAIQRTLGGTIVDSGRGAQVWLLHDDEVATRRALVLKALRQRFGNEHVKIDATHDPSRLMRLPGTLNLKTGRRAEIVIPGDVVVPKGDAVFE